MKGKEVTKSQPISKRQVWEAYKLVKANHGGAGVDMQTLKMFDAELGTNLYKLWNRLSSGCYFPPPVRTVEIPKANGGTRPLGIPTVSDRIAQMVVRNHIETGIDAKFSPSSFGYRKGRSCHDAVSQAESNCKKYAWVIDLDIKGFFDNIDHEHLMWMLNQHVEEKWVLMYVVRWLTAGVERNGEIVARTKGTPQGGVISPLLANLYLHHSFDVWMAREYISNPFERYADDIIVHCKSKKEAEHLLEQIRVQMLGYNLTLHPEKTKIVFCKNEHRRMPDDGEEVKFTFLGFDFQPTGMRSKKGESYLSYCVAISRTAKVKITDAINKMQIPKMIKVSVEDIVDAINPKVRGWMLYYGKFRKWEMQRVMNGLNKRLVQWARNKFKLKGKKASYDYVKSIYKERPCLFAHWAWGMKP